MLDPLGAKMSWKKAKKDFLGKEKRAFQVRYCYFQPFVMAVVNGQTAAGVWIMIITRKYVKTYGKAIKNWGDPVLL
jgi:hypothetical protein